MIRLQALLIVEALPVRCTMKSLNKANWALLNKFLLHKKIKLKFKKNRKKKKKRRKKKKKFLHIALQIIVQSGQALSAPFYREEVKAQRGHLFHLRSHSWVWGPSSLATKIWLFTTCSTASPRNTQIKHSVALKALLV